LTIDLKKETVGKIALDLIKQGDQKQGVIDTQREMLKKYVDNLIVAAREGEKAFGQEKAFYICVQTRRERLLTNVLRNQFYARRTRPAPAYDLALYWYDPKDEQLRFVWNVPDKETVEAMTSYPENVPDDQQQLLSFCQGFIRNTLI